MTTTTGTEQIIERLYGDDVLCCGDAWPRVDEATHGPQCLGHVAQRMENIARDFHVDLDTLTDAQFAALARECGAGR